MFRKERFWAALLLAVLLVCAYGPSLRHFFLSDDFTWLAKARNHSLLFSGPEGFEYSGIFRPIFYLYVQANYSIFGVSPLGWNILQLLLHFGNCLLLAWLVNRLTENNWIGFLAAVSFALHFINIEAVFWLSAASYTLATFFILLTFYLYVHFKDTGNKVHYWASLVSSLLALSSNEQAMALFLTLIVLEFRFPAPRSKRSRTLLPYFLIIGLYTGFRLFTLDFSPPGGAYHPAAGLNFLKNYLFLMVGSLFRLNFMELLNYWQNFQTNGNFSQLISNLAVSPVYLIPLILSPLFYITVFLVYPNARLFILWGFCSLLPVAFFAGTGERLLYLPLTGLLVAMPVFIHNLSKQLGGRKLLYSLTIAWLGYLFIVQQVMLRNWLFASDITRKTVVVIGQTAETTGKSITVCADRPPDNYRGAWVLRMGFEQLGELFYRAELVRTKLRSNADCFLDSNRIVFRGEFKNYELTLKPATQK